MAVAYYVALPFVSTEEGLAPGEGIRTVFPGGAFLPLF